ncbi:triose-phosphate isomerase [Metallumcola ferriviriculae]|uniref:Triosephosphate isomerase n=1 Tax=Metallumcola ferriviriculae TaxID=3039180 RepID=A0AAU0UP30_9FIRM|nr:triose-phosphate isomerase [Desulfitibacteraceae bacterium MK1]
MRKPIIAGNWKMHKNAAEGTVLVKELKQLSAGNTNVEVVVCPPFTALAGVIAEAKGSGIKVGAQNMHWEEKGAYTGEISPTMLMEMGLDYVIIGHSERRQYFSETDETVNKKVKSAYAHGIKPIVCVGETLEQREAASTEQVVGRQIEEGLAGLEQGQVSELVVAYEPIWAIGTGKTASNADAEKVIAHIRRVLAGMYGEQSAEQVRIQYGGSVKPNNINELMEQPNIDGALVGGAALQAESFAGIVNFKA